MIKEELPFERGSVSYKKYKYDNNGNKTELIIGNGAQKTLYEYDKFNRLTKLTDGLGQSEIYTYDDNGNMISKKDRNGNITHNVYDLGNRLVEVYVETSDGRSSSYMKYVYSKTGVKTRDENENLATTYKYNELNQLVKEMDPKGIEKTYTYDLKGNRIGFELKQNGIVRSSLTYDYDKLNRINKTYDNGSLKVSYTYDKNGNRASMVYSSESTKTDHEYDGLSRLDVEKELKTGNEISKKVYTYDKSGNRSKLESTGKEKYTTEYTYDKNNRLITETSAKEGFIVNNPRKRCKNEVV